MTYDANLAAADSAAMQHRLDAAVVDTKETSKINELKPRPGGSPQRPNQ